jgi:hypothetical protein
MHTEQQLSSWNDGAAKSSIVAFVDRVTDESSPRYVPPAARVATFDNDGTLWCEKPMPVQLDFILRQLAAAAEKDPALRERQPWKAAYTKDYGWLGDVVVKHYHGDESGVKALLGTLTSTFCGWGVERYESEAAEFLEQAEHPTLHRPYPACTFLPMVELLRFLEANQFSIYIASGGDRDFMRPFSTSLYGVPPERVIGSSFGLRYEENEHAVIYDDRELGFFDDGAAKPVHIWSRIGRRPLVAGGNSNGDIPMLEFAAESALRLLVLHDDPAREFGYTAGAETALAIAKERDWTVISVKNDWTRVLT